jgi:hypothetical protein
MSSNGYRTFGELSEGAASAFNKQLKRTSKAK